MPLPDTSVLVPIMDIAERCPLAWRLPPIGPFPSVGMSPNPPHRRHKLFPRRNDNRRHPPKLTSPK